MATSTTTARALRAAGLSWRPAKGDRFVIPDRGMDTDVFVVSDMTIEAHDLPSGHTVLGFNGTTEWALDSVEAAEVLWLPHEGQLRARLGESFVALERRGSLWAVLTSRHSGVEPAVTLGEDAEEAYAVALLATTATTAVQLLPVAAAGLAARLVGLGPSGWTARVPDGVRTVADAVGGAVGGVGPDPATGWRVALDALLQAWVAGEAAAAGVVVDIVTATWDVARATGQDERLDPAVVHRALRHVRTWPSSLGARAANGAGEQGELLALTGR